MRFDGGDTGDAPWTGIAAFETRFFAVSHCRSLRGHTFCVNRKYAKSHKRGGDCVFPAPFETPPLNRQRGTVRGSPLIPSKEGKASANQRRFNASFNISRKEYRQCQTSHQPQGVSKGGRGPLWLLRVRVHRERGKSEPPLPMRVFGDFLRVEKVTPRSASAVQHCKKSIKNAAFFKKEPPGFFIPGGFALIQNQ